MEKIHHGDINNPVIYEGYKHIIHEGAMFNHWKAVAASKKIKSVKCICTSCEKYQKIHEVRIHELTQNLNKSCHKCTITIHKVIDRKLNDPTVVYNTAQTCLRIGDIIGAYKIVGKSSKVLYCTGLRKYRDRYIKVECLKCNNIVDVTINWMYTSIRHHRCGQCLDRKEQISISRAKNLNKTHMSSHMLKDIHNMYYDKGMSKREIYDERKYSYRRISRALNNQYLLSVPPNCKRKELDISKVIHVGRFYIFQKDDAFGHWVLVQLLQKGSNELTIFVCRCTFCGKLTNKYMRTLLHLNAARCKGCKGTTVVPKKVDVGNIGIEALYNYVENQSSSTITR